MDKVEFMIRGWLLFLEQSILISEDRLKSRGLENDEVAVVFAPVKRAANELKENMGGVEWLME